MRNAFTLVEMLVAITLLAIMATMVVPMVSGGNDSIRIPTVARTVMTDLMYVQNTAITRQRTMWVFFISDGTNKAFTVAHSSTQAIPATPTWSQASGQANYPSGTFLKQPASGNRYFVVFGQGAPSPMDRAQLSSVKAGADVVTAFGFSPQGEPLKPDGSPYLLPISIVITNASGEVTSTLNISPLTGEITAE